MRSITYYTIVWFALFAFTHTSNAQSNLDSLYAVWNDETVDPILRCEAVELILEEPGYMLMKISLDSTIRMAEKQLDLAERAESTFWIVQAKQTISSLLLMQGKEKESLEMINETYELAKEENNEKAMVLALESFGGYYFTKSDPVKTYTYLTQAIDLATKLKDRKKVAKLSTELGWTVRLTGNYERAIQIYTTALNASKDLNDHIQVIENLLHLSITYYWHEDYKSAKEQLYSALRYLKHPKDSIHFYGTIQQRLAMSFNAENNYAKVIEHASKALSFLEKHPNENMIKSTHYLLAESYQKQNEPDKAKYHLEALINYDPEKRNTYHHMIQVGMLYLKLNEIEKAIQLCSEVREGAESLNSHIHMKGSCECLYLAYRKKGMASKALSYYECFHAYQDSINRSEKSKQIQGMAFSREIMLDSLERAEEKRTLDQAHQTELRKKQQTQNLFLAGGLLALLFAGAFYSRWRYVTRAKKIIEKQKQEVEEAKKVKEQFLANMSHELRTPMHAISGMTKILQRNKHYKQQEPYLNAVRSSSDNLVVILNDILDISKIEAGKLQTESIPISPRTVINNVVDLLRYKAEEKGLVLASKIDDNVPDLVMGDPTRLSQILTNLTGNAIKFTSKGFVNIHLGVSDNFLKFSVRDTGIGIPKDKQEYIFNSFEQSDKSIIRQFGGTGLGLSICKQLTEMQSGTISVESQPDIGSTFIVRLPLIPAESVVDSQFGDKEKFDEMTKQLKGIRILIAEDNTFNQMIVKDDLLYYIEDVQIDLTENGSEALSKFQSGSYDLILMDAQMPVMDGLEASKSIRKMEQSKGTQNAIPIIAMTASLLKSEIEAMTDSGMNNYIPKPYRADELIGTIYREWNKKL